jgi:hypothetical protein
MIFLPPVISMYRSARNDFCYIILLVLLESWLGPLQPTPGLDHLELSNRESSMIKACNRLITLGLASLKIVFEKQPKRRR